MKRGSRSVGAAARRLADALNDRYPTVSIGALPTEAIEGAGYASQVGQDLIVDRLFGGMRSGVFVDVGAHDGVTLSNTAFLEHERGWTGLCIEPNPAVFEKLQQNRARCIEAAIGPSQGTLPFRVIEGYGEMLSGLEGSYSATDLARIERDIAAHGGAWKVIDVPVRRLDEALRTAGITRVDYMTIDVEGGELGVLESIELADFDVAVLSVENNFNSSSIRKAMRRQGYRHLFRLAHDDFFVSNRLGLGRLVVPPGGTHSAPDQ